MTKHCDISESLSNRALFLLARITVPNTQIRPPTVYLLLS